MLDTEISFALENICGFCYNIVIWTDANKAALKGARLSPPVYNAQNGSHYPPDGRTISAMQCREKRWSDVALDDNGPLLCLAIVLLLMVSAFFSCCETAISTVNKLRLRKSADEGNQNAKTALGLAENYDKTLYTVLVGNNIVNIASSSIATVIATAIFGGGGAVIATAVMTVLVITFGEILPKSYGSDNSEKASLSLANPLKLASAILTPLTWVFMKIKLLSSKPADDTPTVTEEELIYMLGSIEEEGVIEEQERDLVRSALEFDEVTIGEIITPRVNVVALDVEDDRETIKNILLEEGYSRIPVYDNGIDNIIGILYARDYLRCLIEGEEANLRDMLSEPLFVHRTMKSSQLLARFKSANTHLAVVTDDYGGTLGIVTMEDLLEELVGDIWDEDDEVSADVIELSESCWEVTGSCDVDVLFELIGKDIYELDTDYNTVNGWAGHIFGHIPEEGETAQYKDLSLTVLDVDGHRIQYLRVCHIPEGGDDNLENQDKDE